MGTGDESGSHRELPAEPALRRGILRATPVAVAVLDDGGEVEHAVLAFQDATEREERQRRFDAVFNNTFQFRGLLDPDGTLVEADDTALAFGGLDREDGFYVADCGPGLPGGDPDGVFDHDHSAGGARFGVVDISTTLSWLGHHPVDVDAD